MAGLFGQAKPPADDPVATFVRAQMEWRRIPGVAIAVIRNGQLLRAQGFGVSDMERRTPVTPDTVF